MSAWWSYRPGDLLMFAPRTYWRLFELYNEALWPGQLLALAAGLLLVALMLSPKVSPKVSLKAPGAHGLRDGRSAARFACALLAAAWLWVAWAFHLQRYATINWAAQGFALAFAVQALLLGLAAAGAGLRRPQGAAPSLWRQWAGVGLVLLALGHPLLGALLGRPWTQAEVFGLAPDPTALGTLGVLLWLAARGSAAWWLWPIPLLWCLASGATLWTMQAPAAALLPALALLAAGLAWRGTRGRRR
jgi:hypothetical protein